MNMKSQFKNMIIRFIEKIHFKAFGHPMSFEMKSFLGNLSWSFVSGALVLPLMMIVTTLAGRLIGPTEYGKYSLLLLINQFLIIFIFFGLDTTSVKYIAKARNFSEKKELLRLSLILFF
jgi:O-antigen/teichoic acid export membrane protein